MFGWIGSPPITQQLEALLRDSKTIDFSITGDSITAEAVMVKEPVKCVADTSVLFSGLQVIDGYTLQENDRVLVAGQLDDSQNGIYIATSGSWSRALDCNSDENVKSKMEVSVQYGTRYADSAWELDIDVDPVSIDSTPLTFRVSNFSYENGKEIKFLQSEWILDSGSYYLEVNHFLNTLRPDVTIFETDDFGDSSIVSVNEIEFVDEDKIRLWVPFISGIPTTFDGYVFIEPSK